MKKIFFIFILTLLIVNCCSQPVTQEWVRRFVNVGGKSVKLDAAGNIYVLLRLYTDSTFNDYGLLKYNSSGNLLWSRIYNSPENISDDPAAFEVNNYGDIYIAGNSGINFQSHIATVKFDSSGNLKWEKHHEGWCEDLMLDIYGNIIVIGGNLVLKYTSNGDTLWSRTFILGAYGNSADKGVTDDSANIYTIGTYSPILYKYHFLTLKYNQYGTLIWYSTYSYDPGYQSDLGKFIAVDRDRNIYVLGISHTLSPSYDDNSLVKINSNGIIQWARVYKGIGGNNACSYTPTDLAVTPDGNRIYYSTASENEGFSSTEFVTLAYNSSGDSIWVRRFPINVHGMPQYNPASLKLDRYNNIYLTGSVYYQTTSGDDYVTIKYLPNGTRQWITTYNGPLTNSGDHAADLIIDTNFNVYVTGISSRQNNPFLFDAATIKYNQPDGIISNNNELPIYYKLCQNYPNPFNSITIIAYELPKRSSVRISIYSITGQLVRTLVNAEQSTGYYSIAVNMDDLASGVYFYKIVAGTFIDTKKLVLLK